MITYEEIRKNEDIAPIFKVRMKPLRRLALRSIPLRM